MLIGQENLRAHFDDLIEHKRLPKLIILAGERGQGKYTLAQHVAERIGDIYQPEDLKVDDIRELVEDAQSLSRRRVYILEDADEMTMQAQNALLKFAEEPTQNAYIIMTIQTENNMLPTIKSRGYMFQLEPYSQEQLRQFTDNEKLIEMFNTPGQIKAAQKVDMAKLEENVERVIDNLTRVSAANAFNIKNHFSDFDDELVLSVLLYKNLEGLRATAAASGQSHHAYLDQIRIIYRYKNQLGNRSINKDNALEMMFLELRREAMK